MKEHAGFSDFSAISIYLGRALTVLIAVFIVVVAVTAFFDRGGGARRNIVDVCVLSSDGVRGEAAYEPFRKLLSHATRRPVVVSHCADVTTDDSDLYIMSTEQYLRDAETLGVVALCEVRTTDRQRDNAVLIARPSDGQIDFAGLAPNDVAFSRSVPVNGCWVQLAMLDERGSAVPSQPSRLRYVGGGDDHSRVVLGVVHGAYRLGACRLSDLTSLAEKGVIDRSEISIVETADALPETVIAARSSEADYYRRKLGELNDLINEPGVPANQVETVTLLKAYGIQGLDPMSDARMERARILYDKYGTSAVAP